MGSPRTKNWKRTREVDLILIVGQNGSMRVKLNKNDLENLFAEVRRGNLSQTHMATRLGVSTRTLNDWGNGRATIPQTAFKFLMRVGHIKQRELSPALLPDYWHIKDASRKGAYKRMEIYGNFGTPEGRKKGGLNSLKIHNKNKDGFKVLKPIRTVRKSRRLAELMGILIGDGHLSKYQVSITTNSVTDKEHALFTKNLVKELFNVTPTIKNRRDENTLTLVISSKKLVQFLNKLGMPIGNKIKNDLSIPRWIFKNPSYKKFFLRGLFDTDGCIYIDIHKNGNRKYKNIGWTITSYADKLLSGVIKILRGFGYTPTHRV